MAIPTLFRSLTSRPGVRVIPKTATLVPVTGKILNPTAKPVVKAVPNQPLATRPSVVAIPKPVAKVKAAASAPQLIQNVIARATKPKPEQPTSATPNTLLHRAINNLGAQVRMPDRGSFFTRQGAALVMPDGTLGGSPVTPAPIRQSLSSIYNQITFGGGTPQVRQTQVGAIAREAYVDRQRARPVVAAVATQVRRGLVQRAGSAVVLRSMPGSLGALDKAQFHRIKTGTPTGVVGDRAVQYPTAHVGATYARTIAPAVTNAAYLGQKIGGSALATTPSPYAPSVIDKPSLGVTESIGKAYAWAPPDVGASTPASAAVAVENNGERWGLLLGVAVIAFLLIRR